MRAPPPNFVRRHACRTSCIAASRRCVHRPAGNLRSAVRQTLSFAPERKNTLSAHRPAPRLFLHACLWRSPTAQFSALRVALSTRTVSDPTHPYISWASQVWVAALLLDRSTTWARSRQPVLAIPRTVTRLRLSDPRDRGSCCAFCRVGQGHRWLIVQLDMRVIFSMATVSPRLRRSERSLGDPLDQFPRLVLRIHIPQPCGDLACKSSKWCAA